MYLLTGRFLDEKACGVGYIIIFLADWMRELIDELVAGFVLTIVFVLDSFKEFFDDNLLYSGFFYALFPKWN